MWQINPLFQPRVMFHPVIESVLTNHVFIFKVYVTLSRLLQMTLCSYCLKKIFLFHRYSYYWVSKSSSHVQHWCSENSLSEKWRKMWRFLGCKDRWRFYYKV